MSERSEFSDQCRRIWGLPGDLSTYLISLWEEKDWNLFDRAPLDEGLAVFVEFLEDRTVIDSSTAQTIMTWPGLRREGRRDEEREEPRSSRRAVPPPQAPRRDHGERDVRRDPRPVYQDSVRARPRNTGSSRPKFVNPFGGLIDGIDDRLPRNTPDFINGAVVLFGGVALIAILVIFALAFAFMRGGGGAPQALGLPGATAMPSVMPLPPGATTPTQGGVFGFSVQGPPKVDVDVNVTLASVWVLMIIVFGFAETVSRRERFALDWWAPILFVSVAVLRDQFSHDLWLFLQTAGAAAVLAAIALNENRPAGSSGKGVWAQVFNLVTGTLDMTPFYQVGALLLALGYAQWTIMPYPAWIDPKVAWAVLIIGGLFEISRAPIATLLAIGLGAVAGFAFDPWITVVVTLVVMVMGMIGHQVGWLPSSGHKMENSMNVMGRDLTVVIRWDLILLASIAFFLVALTTHGNIILYALTRTAGG